MKPTPIVMALQLCLAGVALADVPPYQPPEDACSGHSVGAACTINTAMLDEPFIDGGSGICDPGGTCSTREPSMSLPDAGWACCNSEGQSCTYSQGTFPEQCYVSSSCLQCVVQANTSAGSSAAAASSSGTSSGSTTGGTTGSTAGSGSVTGGAGSSTVGSAGSTAAASSASGSSGSSTGSSSSSGGGCNGTATTFAPWLLALLVPALVRRKR